MKALINKQHTGPLANVREYTCFDDLVLREKYRATYISRVG